MKLWQKDKASLQEVEKFTVGKDNELDLYLAPFDAFDVRQIIKGLKQPRPNRYLKLTAGYRIRSFIDTKWGFK